MRIELILEDGSEATITIDDDGTTLAHDDELTNLANDAAAGPPPWAGPLEVVRQWLDEHPDVQATEIGVPVLPSEPDRVY